MKSRLEKMIAIPDYWHDYVNPKVDLRANPKQPCPFHHENTVSHSPTVLTKIISPVSVLAMCWVET